MNVEIKELLANIANYEDWDYKAYPLQKEEAELIIHIIKEKGESDET